jgi:hypothetical protein
LLDLNFIGLKTGAEFIVGGRPVTGNLELDNVLFEAAASYLVSVPARSAIIGGLRTYTLSRKIALQRAPDRYALPRCTRRGHERGGSAAAAKSVGSFATPQSGAKGIKRRDSTL